MQSRTPAASKVRPPSLKQINDPDYWRLRAEEAMEMAYEMRDGDAISKMLEVVQRYDRLARQAESRLEADMG